MRLNKYIAASSSLSRRAADAAIEQGRVLVNGKRPEQGQQVSEQDKVTLDGHDIAPAANTTTIMLNKPVGYVVSRNGQGGKTIYDILPPKYHDLNPVGRLDKDSSGLLLLTNDGQLANELTHPRYQKIKVYDIELDAPLQPLHRQMINDYGVQLEDGPSKLQLDRLQEGSDTKWKVTMSEGRNRQIRRTFATLGYEVTKLHRTHFGIYALQALKIGSYQDC